MAATSPGMTLDVSGTGPVPFSRLVRVETRKMADTRAGVWLLAAIALVTAAAVVIVFLTSEPGERTFLLFMGATATPQGLLLPVMGILLVTSEWSQRTALVTFTLEPSRMRVVWAKVVAALLLGAAAIVVAVGLAALAAAVGGHSDPFQRMGLDDLGKFAILQVSGLLQGLAFGLLLLNSPAAIVLYFVLPTAFNIVASLWDAMAEAAPWIDLATAQTPLFTDVDLTGEQWAQLGSVTALWILLPFVLGLWRVLHAEVK